MIIFHTTNDAQNGVSLPHQERAALSIRSMTPRIRSFALTGRWSEG
jgi:hypothetical protein